MLINITYIDIVTTPEFSLAYQNLALYIRGMRTSLPETFKAHEFIFVSMNSILACLAYIRILTSRKIAETLRALLTLRLEYEICTEYRVFVLYKRPLKLSHLDFFLTLQAFVGAGSGGGLNWPGHGGT